jgi:flagella basal body P-ring formation protein FlgA
MRLLLAMIGAGTLLGADCIVVSSNTIFARDITGTVPMFLSVDPETVIAFAPAPGVRRILSPRDLIAAARKQGIAGEPGPTLSSVCVERDARPIDVTDLTEVLQAALALPDAHLTILDFSKQRIPSGHMEFSLSGLNKPPESGPGTPVIWRGRLVYDGQRSLSIWAKVSLTVERPALVAAEQIAAGSILRTEQLAVRLTNQFPFGAHALDSIPQAAGKAARRTIPAGQIILATALADSEDVVRGETVHVEVIDGLALLTLDAVAESSGRRGDPVTLRNPSSGRTFRGVVADKGRVIVRSSSGD